MEGPASVAVAPPTRSEGGAPDRLARRAARLAIWTAAAVIVAVNAAHVVSMIGRPAPHGPWEAGQTVEAWRSSRGLPVYEDIELGHATHMYGALAPHALGAIFRLTGPNNVAGRALSLAASLMVTALLAAVAGRLGAGDRRGAGAVVAASAVLIAANSRCGDYFVENRPDMTALLFSYVGLALLATAQLGRRGWALAPGVAFLVVGVFFKQTSAMFAAVPALAVWADRSSPRGVRLRIALLPPLAIGSAIVALRVAWPAAFDAMIRIPGQYEVAPVDVARMTKRMLVGAPLFLAMMGEWLAVGPADPREARGGAWVLATLAVTIPASIVSAAKMGGMENCFLPAILAILTFCGWRMSRVVDRAFAAPDAGPVRAMATGAFVASLMLLTAFPQSGGTLSIRPRPDPWDLEYEAVVRLASRLPGTVICPEDPTIPVLAGGKAGRNVFLELDCRPTGGTWPSEIPSPVWDEVASADFVVDVLDWWQDPIRGRDLEAIGLRPLARPDATFAHYCIWERPKTARLPPDRPRRAHAAPPILGRRGPRDDGPRASPGGRSPG